MQVRRCCFAGHGQCCAEEVEALPLCSCQCTLRVAGCKSFSNPHHPSSLQVAEGREEEEQLLEAVREALGAKHVIRVCSSYEQVGWLALCGGSAHDQACT